MILSQGGDRSDQDNVTLPYQCICVYIYIYIALEYVIA